MRPNNRLSTLIATSSRRALSETNLGIHPRSFPSLRRAADPATHAPRRRVPDGHAHAIPDRNALPRRIDSASLRLCVHAPASPSISTDVSSPSQPIHAVLHCNHCGAADRKESICDPEDARSGPSRMKADVTVSACSCSLSIDCSSTTELFDINPSSKGYLGCFPTLCRILSSIGSKLFSRTEMSKRHCR